MALLGNQIAFLGALGLPLTGLAARSIGGMVRRVTQPHERSITLLSRAYSTDAAEWREQVDDTRRHAGERDDDAH